MLAGLLRELSAYPQPTRQSADTRQQQALPASGAPAACHARGLLSFLSTTTVFGTPVDITLSELALETFFPADAATAEALRKLAAYSPP